ncbi:MAG: hypothetical protein ACREJP_01885, partial [Candidatus Methylomirabilales bacterium]
LAVGEGRFIVGLLTPGQDLISHGAVKMRFAFLGTKSNPRSAKYGLPVTGRFLPIPASPSGPSEGPVAGPASEGRGVYGTQASFDRHGFWQVEVAADLKGDGPRTGTAAFRVLEKHRVAGPGDDAPRTENLTLDSKDAPRAAIESRANGELPDPELHRTTIAAAIQAGRPALVVFATPVYCVSRFCGPVTDMVAELAGEYGDRAEFIHVEIWRDFDQGTVNRAAAEWLLREGDLQEPWVFLIGGDGKVAARWDNVATRGEIEPPLRRLP